MPGSTPPTRGGSPTVGYRVEDRADPLVSPYEAGSLVGLPAAVVAVAEVDPLRGGALAYAERLRADGVDTTVVMATGQVHGYLTMPGLVGGEQAVASAHRALRRLVVHKGAVGPLEPR